MSHINFVIPIDKAELLSEGRDSYCVKNVVSIKEVLPKLREAKQYFKDEGPEFIVENFDTFYSVLHHSDTLQMDILMVSYEMLHKAVLGLNNVLKFLLEDRDNLNEELNMKYLSVIKMLLYIYCNTVIMIEQKVEFRRSQSLPLKGRAKKKSADESLPFGCNRQQVILYLNNILQREINVFWDPPVAEDSFIRMLASVCYKFLEMPNLKQDKDLQNEIFNLLGVLIKGYNYSMSFVIRTVQLVKIYEHLIHVVPKGIELLVENFNCKSLIRDFVKEITEWQTDENIQDSQGGRYCSSILSAMANLMPTLMIPEVMYLNRYLAHTSYALRNSVLHVMVEVVLNVLTKEDSTEEQKEQRDELLLILEEHIDDTTGFVRTKVFQHWSKLQIENAVPLKMQTRILEKAVLHLRDKAAMVRKTAANCVTVFLSHNVYGAELKLDVLQSQFHQKDEELNNLKAKLEDNHVEQLKKAQQKWSSKAKKLEAVIKRKLEEDVPDNLNNSEITKDQLSQIVWVYLAEDKFDEAFNVCRQVGSTFPAWQEIGKAANKEEEVQLYLSLLQAIYLDGTNYGQRKSTNGTQTSLMPSEADLEQLVALENSVQYLKEAVDFLKAIDTALKPMADLLESSSIGDMQEAIEFFVTAYKFQINNVMMGILEMLKIMQRNEKERKDHIVNAFKSIYLTTDSNNMDEHTVTVVKCLIDLLLNVPYNNVDDLSIIIAEWVSRSDLDNGVIDKLWQYVTKKVEVTDEHSRAALCLLKIAGKGRRTIVTKNIKLVCAIAFGDRGKTDILLVKAGCEILDIAGRDKQEITDPKPPFRIGVNDPVWKNLVELVTDFFHKKSEFFNGMFSSAVRCIYSLCNKPEEICEQIIEKILNSIQDNQSDNNDVELEGTLIGQCVHILGEVANSELNYLDEVVYKELKRRNYIREERSRDKKNTKKKVNTQLRNPTSKIRLTMNSVQSSVIDNSSVPTVAERTLDGAQADDTDAEFILNTLENHVVSECTSLGELATLIINICERPDVYDHIYLQGTAIISLLRFMLVSSTFCKNHIQLIFKVLEKTIYPDIKCSILIHCSDLLERFPNIIEPWSVRIFERLRDKCNDVRITAFFVLANLILRDMIRVQGRISELAYCIMDENECLRDMSKTFFIQLSHKANYLYNVLPDTFSHLNDMQNIETTNLREIMKFLFGLIDKNKQMENLVDRFCIKIPLSKNEQEIRNIIYCLTLIQYNDKALKKLSENFIVYKPNLQDCEVFGFFKQITNTYIKSQKNEIKEIAAELEQKIDSVFEINENGDTRSPSTRNAMSRTNLQKSAFKKPKARAPKKKPKTEKNNDSDHSDEERENTAPKHSLRRTRRTPRKIAAADLSDSGSD